MFVDYGYPQTKEYLQKKFLDDHMDLICPWKYNEQQLKLMELTRKHKRALKQ